MYELKLQTNDKNVYEYFKVMIDNAGGILERESTTYNMYHSEMQRASEWWISHLQEKTK